MRRQVALCLEAGVDGIVVLGLATEVAKLTEAEQRSVIAWAIEDVAGRVPLGVTVYGNSIVAQLELLRAAERAGADWLILQPPAVGTYGGGELLRGFGRLADAATVPVAIQNAPALMGRGLDADGIAALVAAHPNITHLKGEMPVVQLEQVIQACGDRLTVLNGQAGLEMIDSLRAGLPGLRPRARHGRPCGPDLAPVARRATGGCGQGLRRPAAGDRVRHALARASDRLRQADLRPARRARGPRPGAVRTGRRRSVSPAPSAMPRLWARSGSSHADRREPARRLRHPDRPGRRGARRVARGRAREAGHRRRERLGQVHGRTRDHGPPAHRRPMVTADRMEFEGVDLRRATRAQWRDLRGGRIGMVLQDPKYSLNPVMRVGDQIEESLRDHQGLRGREARSRVRELLAAVRIRDPRRVAAAWPHELSGGMGQRVMIAMMLAGEPDLMIADEPTSALDVTVQLQVLAILDDLVTERGMGLIFISHDLELVATFCDRVAIMYAGRVVEVCRASELHAATHPYTKGLLGCLPRLDRPQQRLPVLVRDAAWLEGGR